MNNICILNGDNDFLEKISDAITDIKFCEDSTDSSTSNKEDLSYILVNKSGNSFESLVYQLLKITDREETFIWIYSEKKLNIEEKIILFELKVNIILDESLKMDGLIASINNAISYIKKLKNDASHPNNQKRQVFLEVKNRTLNINEERVSLTKLEWLLLSKLMEFSGDVVSYEELNKSIGGTHNEYYKLRISNIIFHLREKIKNNKYVEIMNIRSIGYGINVHI